MESGLERSKEQIEKKLKIALWMKKRGMSNEEIKEATGLELSEIKEL